MERQMDIYTYIKKDHRKVDQLMQQLTKSSDTGEQEELFEMIQKELSAHADSEEKTFYAELQAKGGKQVKEKEEHAEEEHDEIRQYIKKLNRIDFDSDEWLITFGEFKYAVQHHVKEEEEEIFEKAKKLISEKRAQELAEEMDALKQQQKGKKRAA
jgi:hemerythrin superfamily protein